MDKEIKKGLITMSQNIEIEFKNMLTKEEFIKFQSHFNVKSSDFLKQENHYFDTYDFTLKEYGCALRIREKKGRFEMTLKQPHPEGLLETNEMLSDAQAHSLLNGGPIMDGVVKTQILTMNVNIDEIRYFGSLVTDRAELSYLDGLLVLDFSSYLNVQDYEVEYEVSNRDSGESIFLDLLSELNVPIRKSKNKVKRFYDEQKRQRNI
jgi:uncharacterized protein YjbK